MFDLKSVLPLLATLCISLESLKLTQRRVLGEAQTGGRFFDAPPAHREGHPFGYQPPDTVLSELGIADIQARLDQLAAWPRVLLRCSGIRFLCALTFKSVTEFFSWQGCCLHSCLPAGRSDLEDQVSWCFDCLWCFLKGRKGCHLFKWHSALGKECFWFLECLSEAIIPWLTRLPFKCLLTLAPMLGSEDLISILLLKPACFESSPEF